MFNPSTYARVIAFLAAAAVAPSTTWANNLLLNPGAEQGKAENPSVWEQASVAADELRMERTTSKLRSGKASLMIANEHVYDKPVANNWMQALQEVPHGEVLRV